MVFYLEVIAFVVMHIKTSEEFRVSAHCQFSHISDSFHQGMAGKLLHLDVVEFSEVTEPFDELRRDTARELGTQNQLG